MVQESLNFKKSKLKPITRLQLLLALSVFIFICDAFFHATESVRSKLLFISAPIQKVLNYPARKWSDFREIITKQEVLVEYNKKLLEQNTRLSAQLSLKQNLEKDNEELKRQLQIHNNGINPVAFAEVVASDLSQERMTLNRGSKDGVAEGQAVVDGHGLVGQIVAVSSHNSQMVVSHYKRMVIPVVVVRTGYKTLLYGDETNHLDLRYFPVDEDLKLNDLLVTSGLDANFPAGIPVARVSRLEVAVGIPFYRSAVESLGNINTSRYVMILQHNRPQEINFRQPENNNKENMP